MNLPMEERKEILAEIDEFTDEPELGPDEVTVRMYANHKNISISQASNRLEKKWEEGRLMRREVLHRGKRKKAYSVAENDGGCSGIEGD